MISPLNIATDGYLCSPFSISIVGYICIDDLCSDSRYGVMFFYDLGYSIHDVIVVKKKDIKVTNNGAGITMTFMQGKHCYTVDTANMFGARKSRELLVCEFVSSLNNMPLLK